MTLSVRISAALTAAMLLSASAGAQQAPPDCSAPEHSQFDFWVGSWNVFNRAGQQVGTNTITKQLDGCVLHERWESAGSNRGNSYNIYDRTTARWHQTWVDNGGSLLLLDGGLHEGSMVLEGRTRRADGTVALQRITWTARADASVRQIWEQSADGGQTWAVVFDGKYVRKE